MNIQPKEQQLTEKEYRRLELNSYSSIKTYIESPLKFYKKFVTKETKGEEPSADMILGSLVDCLLLPSEPFDSKFEICTVSEIDKDANHMNYFAWTLWEKTVQFTNEEGVLTKDFAYLCEESYNDSKYNRQGEVVRFKVKTLEKVIEDFEGSNLELWYRQKRTSVGKMLVSTQDIDNAEKIVQELKISPITADIVNLVTDDRYTVHNQLIIFFHYKGMDIKLMLDKMVLDHEKKTVSLYDLKVTWEVLNFGYNYLKNSYYLQGAVYYKGVEEWMKENIADWEDWTIVPMQFIVAHSANFLQPLVYQTTKKDLEAAINGFTVRGKKYMGLMEAVESINWGLETGKWNISYSNYKINGHKPLDITYE